MFEVIGFGVAILILVVTLRHDRKLAREERDRAAAAEGFQRVMAAKAKLESVFLTGFEDVDDELVEPVMGHLAAMASVVSVDADLENDMARLAHLSNFRWVMARFEGEPPKRTVSFVFAAAAERLRAVARAEEKPDGWSDRLEQFERVLARAEEILEEEQEANAEAQEKWLRERSQRRAEGQKGDASES